MNISKVSFVLCLLIIGITTGCIYENKDANLPSIATPAYKNSLASYAPTSTTPILKDSSIPPTFTPKPNKINSKKTPSYNSNQLINILEVDPSFVVDLKYATEDNFTHTKVYKFNDCLLRKETAFKLKTANIKLKTQNLRLKIFDGYRPPEAQKFFWDIVKDEKYVAPPSIGSVHSRGGAVDITLVDIHENELEMPSKFDDFSSKASRNNTMTTKKALENLSILTNVMRQSGFTTIDTEWWHYNDSNSKNFRIIDANPSLFSEK